MTTSSSHEYKFASWSIENQPIMNAAAFVTLLIMCTGILGNSLTIIALIKTPRIRNVASAFILCLGIADLLFCTTVLPFCALRFFNYDDWAKVPELCSIVPFMQYGIVGVSLLFISMITISRYVMIVHTNLYGKIYQPIWIGCMITFCLSLAFGMQVPTLLGKWGQFKHDPNLGTCSITPDGQGRSSKSALFIIGFVIPCIVIVCCYTGIFWVVHESANRIRHQQHPTGNGVSVNSAQALKRSRNEWRLTKMVLAVFLSFVICYLPITIVKITDPNANFPVLHIIAYITLYASACFNPIIYVIMNKQYRKAYKSILSFGCCESAATRVPVLRSISKRLHPHGKTEEDGCKTVISQVSIALEQLDNNNRNMNSLI